MRTPLLVSNAVLASKLVFVLNTPQILKTMRGNMKKIILSLLLSLIASVSTLYSQITKLNDKSKINDSEIVAPEHLNKQLATLIHDWQIDLSKSNFKCDQQGSNIVYSDSIYTQRLYDFPSEMELSYNSVVKNYIDMYTIRRRDLVSYMLTVGEYYFPMFEEALDREGLPLELKYLPVIESALNPVAVSRVGATGLWQFMLRTGQGYGLQVNSLVDERRDPYKSTEAAVKYLKDLYSIYEDWNLVIAAYNCGPGNVNKAITRSGGKRDYWEIYYNLPKETRGYVPAFIAANYVMNYYDKHAICPVESQLDIVALDTIQVDKQVHFNQISKALDIPITDIRRWNPQFKKDVIPGNFKNYSLVLPTSKVYAFLEKEDEIINLNKDNLLNHRENTDNYIAGSTTTSTGNTANVYYKVRSGDTLSKIASRNRTTVAQIQRWNNMRTTRLSVGKNLIVQKQAIKTTEPDKTVLAKNNATNTTTKSVNQYYRIRRGDNLGKIASRNGVTVAQLKTWNSLKSDRISVGKNLIVNIKEEIIEEEIPTPLVDIENAPDDITNISKEEMQLKTTEVINIDPSPIIIGES